MIRYQTSNVTLYNTDCCDMPAPDTKPSLILTDPPFATGKTQSRVNGESYEDRESAQIVSERIKLVCEKWFGPDTTLAVICDYRLAYELVKTLTEFGLCLRGEIIWSFELGRGRSDWWANKHNHILTFTETATSGKFYDKKVPRIKRKADSEGYPMDKPVGSVWQYTFNNTNSERVKYPNQKPLRILRPFVRVHTDINDLVLDPFMGSGSPGIAAIRDSRKFIGCDIKTEAVDIAIERIMPYDR